MALVPADEAVDASLGGGLAVGARRDGVDLGRRVGRRAAAATAAAAAGLLLLGRLAARLARPARAAPTLALTLTQ